MSKASNRAKQYARRKKSNKAWKPRVDVSKVTLDYFDRPKPEKKPRTYKPYRPHPKLRSRQPSRAQKRRRIEMAHVQSVRKAFKTMGANVRVTKANYRHFFKILEDAKITAGEMKYAAFIRYSSEAVDLERYQGRLFDLVWNRQQGFITLW